MKQGKRQNLTVDQLVDLFHFMLDHELSQYDLANLCGVYPSTIVRWKEKIKSKDEDLYQLLQQSADEKNYHDPKIDPKKRTYDIANAVIKYHFNLKQAIIYCDYDISRSRVSHDLEDYLDKKTYIEVKKILKTLKNSVAEMLRFEKLLAEKRFSEKVQAQNSLPTKNEKIVANDITMAEKEKVALECVNYIVENHVSLLQASKKYHVAKTTMVRWIYEFVPKNKKLYQQFLLIMEEQNKQVLSKSNELKKQKETLYLAYFILEHPEMPFNKIVENFSPYISRTTATRYIYHDLYELDTTPHKSLYLSVMRQIAKFDRRGIEHSQSKQIISQVEQEVAQNCTQSVRPKDIEKRILMASERILNGEMPVTIAQDMGVTEIDMMNSIKEVLPLINNQMYQLLQVKTNLIDKTEENQLKLSIIK